MTRPVVSGFCSPRFEPVREVFADLFAGGEEVGASVAVCHRGEAVVDLWAGWRDAACTRPWEHDTVVITMSASKAAMNVLMMALIDRGLFELDAPIAAWWPEFAANGKGGVLLRHVLAHTSGVPAIRVPEGSGYDWDLMVAACRDAIPMTPPGTHAAYHSLTQQWILGEIVRRVTGRTWRDVYECELKHPLALDLHYGLTNAQMASCADFLFEPDPTSSYRNLGDPSSLPALTALPLGRNLDFNDIRLRRAAMPAVSGCGNARAFARLFHPLALGGRWGVACVASNPELLREFATEQWRGDGDLGYNCFRMGLGFLLNDPPSIDYGPSPNSFGSPGTGGVVGMADRDHELSYGYAPNKAYVGKGIGPRNARLLNVVYACL